MVSIRKSGSSAFVNRQTSQNAVATQIVAHMICGSDEGCCVEALTCPASEWSDALANIASTSSAVAQCRQIVTLSDGRRRVPIGRNRCPLSIGLGGRFPSE
jgi:hypothetical protein